MTKLANATVIAFTTDNAGPRSFAWDGYGKTTLGALSAAAEKAGCEAPVSKVCERNAPRA